MTRKEALIFAEKAKYLYEREELINKIYDDFENRICKNCEFSNPEAEGVMRDKYKCSILMSFTEKQAENLIKDGFGCNRFKGDK